MPRKRAGDIIVTAPNGETETTHLATPHQGVDAEELADDTLLALDELGATASAVIIERMRDDKPGEWTYLTRMQASEYKTETLKEQYGGGDYRVTVIDTVKGRLNPVLVSIDKRFTGKLFANTPAPVQSAGVANDPFRDRLLEVVLAKILSTPAAPANSTKETIELVLAVVGALKGGDNGSTLEQFKTMFEMSKTMADMANPPEGIAGALANFAPVMERIVSSNRPAARITRTLPPAPVAHAPAPNPTPVRPTPPAPTPATVAGYIFPKWLEPFRLYAGQLVKIADRNSDPVMYADLALEEIQEDETAFAAAVEAMNENRLLPDLFAICPDLQKTDARKEFANAFVAAFASGLQEIVSAPEDESEASANG